MTGRIVKALIAAVYLAQFSTFLHFKQDIDNNACFNNPFNALTKHSRRLDVTYEMQYAHEGTLHITASTFLCFAE